MTINTGYTYDPTPEQRARQQYETCLHFLRSCQIPEDGKRSVQAEYWFNHVVKGFNELRPYATDEEHLIYLGVLLDFATIDPGHRRRAVQVPEATHLDIGYLVKDKYMEAVPLNEMTPEQQREWFDGIEEMEF